MLQCKIAHLNFRAWRAESLARSGTSTGSHSSGTMAASGAGAPAVKKDDAGLMAAIARTEGRLGEQAGLVRFYARPTASGGAAVFSAHGASALMIAQDYYKSTSVLTEQSGMQTVTMYKNLWRDIVRDMLLQRSMKVQLWGVDSEGGGSKANPTLQLERSASPGQLADFEDELAGAQSAQGGAGQRDPSVLAALQLRTAAAAGNEVGLAFADSSGERVLHVCQFADEDDFANLESVLVQAGVKEVITSLKADALPPKAKAALERARVVHTVRPAKDFDAKDIEQDLRRLLGNHHSAQPHSERPLALASASAVIRFLELLSNESNFGSYRMKDFHLSHFLRLDGAAIHALNLQASRDDPSRSSLFGLLDRCNSAMGSRLLHMWMKQPLLDQEQIRRRQDLVEAFVTDVSLRQNLRETHMRRLPDLRRYCKKLTSGRAKLVDLMALYDFLRKLPDFVECLKGYDGEHHELVESAFTEKLDQVHRECTKLMQMVEATIDMDELANRNYRINPKFDEKLEELKDEMDEAYAEIAAQHSQTARNIFGGSKDANKLKLERGAENGFIFRMTSKDESKIRGKSEYNVLKTNKTGVQFETRQLRRLSDGYTELSNQYERDQQALSQRALEIASGYVPLLEIAEVMLSELDVLLSFAVVSTTAPIAYTRPKMLAQGSHVLELKGARHPMVEAVQQDRQFIANDVSMNPTDSMLQIITGPNMGGKSTYIRQVGVIILMAQMGCFVPCASARISIVDCILARVGAGDSQARGVSTFMSEMLETAAILRTASASSFVIIDELGRGTSTYDGFGIAWAICEHLAKQTKALCLFATHFHELTALADTEPTVSNQHVTAQAANDELTFLYKVAAGPCDQSFGIHVARLAKFPSDVVAMAKRKAEELEDFTPQRATKSSKTDADVSAEVAAQYVEQFLELPFNDPERLMSELTTFKSKVSALLA